MKYKHEGNREINGIQNLLRRKIKEIELKEELSNIANDEKIKFYIFIKELIQLNLISPKDAQDLITAMENGQMSLKEAYRLVEDVIETAKAESLS